MKIFSALVMLFALYGMAAGQSPGSGVETNSTSGESALVYPGEDGKLIYVQHANTQEYNEDNIIPDYSRCGYMDGGTAIPDVPVKITVFPQIGDDRQRIQDAIDYVSGLTPDDNGIRGAVLLKAGTYQVDAGLKEHGDALTIEANGVVLRGEGQGAGGTIIQTTFEAKHQIIATRPYNPSFSTSDRTPITDPYVGSGATSFHVADASAYSVGDTIFVTFTPNQTWLDDIYANAYMKSDDLDWTTATYIVKYERRITDIYSNNITIHSPVILPMQTRFGGGEITKMRISRGFRLQQIGVENLRLVGPGETASCPVDDPNRLKTGVHFEFTENSWVRGVTVVHTSNSAVYLWSSNHNTIEDCASVHPIGHKRGGYRYTYYITGNSSHNLFQRTYAEDGRHDYVLGQRTPGPNVFLDGYTIEGGTTGLHQRWATGTLFDNLKLESLIALEHRGSSGTGHSWAGIQSIIWNTETPTIICDAPVGHLNYAIGAVGNEILSQYVDNTEAGVYRGYYDSHGTHVDTRSLYLKQLEDRLGDTAVGKITIPGQRHGNIYDLLADWAGEGVLTDTAGAGIIAPGNLRPSAYSFSDTLRFVTLEWTDMAMDETYYQLERSSDGGNTFELLVALSDDTEIYTDTAVQQSSYHYRLRAVNDIGVSAYVHIYVDLLEELPAGEITFRVNMSEISDLFAGGDVWLLISDQDTRYMLTDTSGDNIYHVTVTIAEGKDLAYRFAYQSGPDPGVNVVEETVSAGCGTDGFRTLYVEGIDLVLPAVLFGGCEGALPSGFDITDLEGTVITGSNDNEPWEGATSGAGSPPGEGITMLIDSNNETKYLVRAETSWIEIFTTRFSVVTGYTITSANDVPPRDPRSWKLQGFDAAAGQWVTIHTVSDNPVWEQRFMRRSWTFENDKSYSRYRLQITAINGDSQGLMQMAELQLWGELGDYTPVAESVAPVFLIYPNPTEGKLYIRNPLGDNFSYQVYSISGKLVSFRQGIGGRTTGIDLSGLRKGLYIFVARSANGSVVHKVILK